MTFDSLLNTHINIQSKYSSQNSYGEWTYSYSGASTNTVCRLMPLTARERIDTTGLFDNVKYKCFCTSGTAIDRDNRITHAGETYRVREVIIDSSFHHKTALLEEIT